MIATLQQAAATRHTQAAPHVALAYAGTTTAAVVANNHTNTVFFRPEASGSTMAVTYYWWGYNVVTNAPVLVDFDIKFFDASFRWFAGETGCSGGDYVLDVATHEFGHGLGLNHTSVPAATMWPSTGACSPAWRSLDADDIAGIEAQYPGARPRQPWTLMVGP